MADRLKDQFFQRPFFETLARELAAVHPAFDQGRFLRLIYDDGWEQRELKARMRHAAEVLEKTLPPDYRQALGLLMRVEGRFSGFDHLVFADFVERFGVSDYEASIPALERLTRTTAEFAIRPFIRKYPERTMRQMLAWAKSGDEKLRRLASEGCRPRLPWGDALQAFKKDPTPILPILEALKDDPSEMVRRSVANNLNDISKDHPERALEIAAGWLKQKKSRAPLVKHALRGLLKKGDRRAISLFALDSEAKVKVAAVEVTPRRIPLGGRGSLRAELVSTGRAPQKLRLEYEMGFARPGGRWATKVFQIREVELAPRQRLSLTRKLDFSDRTTRKHHPGEHTATLVVNGRRTTTARFSLVRPAPAKKK